MEPLLNIPYLDYIITGDVALAFYIHKSNPKSLKKALKEIPKIEILSSKEIQELPPNVINHVVSPLFFSHLSHLATVIQNHQISCKRWLKIHYLRKFNNSETLSNISEHQTLLDIFDILKENSVNPPENTNYDLSRNVVNTFDKYILKHNLVVCGRKAQELTAFCMKNKPQIPFFILLSTKPGTITKMLSSELKGTSYQLLDCSKNSPKIYEIYETKTGKVYAYVIQKNNDKSATATNLVINGYHVANIPTIAYILGTCSIYLPLSINRDILENYTEHLSKMFIALKTPTNENN